MSFLQAIEALIREGMSVARLNFSHGGREYFEKMVAIVRELEEEIGMVLTILQDLSGPKIRTGPMAADQVILQPDQASDKVVGQIGIGVEVVEVAPAEEAVGRHLALARPQPGQHDRQKAQVLHPLGIPGGLERLVCAAGSGIQHFALWKLPV